MKSTVTVHWNTGEVAHEHNQRDEELCKNEKHIDLKNAHGKSFHEVLYRSDMREKYGEIFGQAIDDYNNKQKRESRKISVESYMESVYADTRGKRQTKWVNGKRVAKEDGESRKKGKQLSYEVTVKVGNTEVDRNEDGVKLYFGKRERRSEYLPREVQQRALRRYYEGFQARNPNFRLVNADLHCDEGYTNKKGEWEYAADGLHLEFIPIADGFKQGLATQNSLNKALKQQGFSGNDGCVKWAEREQEILAEIAKDEYAKFHASLGHKHERLEIYHPVREKKRQGGMTKEQYIKTKELDDREAGIELEYKRVRQKAKDDAEEELSELKAEIETLKQTKAELESGVQTLIDRESAVEGREKAQDAREEGFKTERDNFDAEKKNWQETANKSLLRLKMKLRTEYEKRYSAKLKALEEMHDQYKEQWANLSVEEQKQLYADRGYTEAEFESSYYDATSDKPTFDEPEISL